MATREEMKPGGIPSYDDNQKPAKTKQDTIREGMLHEVCAICVHKPTHYRKSSFEKDKAVQVYGSGCSYGFEEGSSKYCSLAHKVVTAILRKQTSQGVVIKVDNGADLTGCCIARLEPLIGA